MTGRRLLYYLNGLYRRHEGLLDGAAGVLAVLTFGAAVACLVLLIIYAGYEHSLTEARHIRVWLRLIQCLFLINILFNFLFRPATTIKSTSWVKWLVDLAMIATLPMAVWPRPGNPWWPAVTDVLYSNVFFFSVLGIYSILVICYGLLRLVSRRTNPSLILAGSFVLVIIIGSFMLMLPRCLNYPISYVDSLFLSTSAVCITGLTPIDVATAFTPLGLLILAILIQLGALGIMTFTSFFALFFSGSTSLYNQLMIKDMVYSKTMNALIPTLLFILGFTFTVEAIGALGVFLTIHGQLGLPTVGDEVVFACFHSLSAFCNAGFSNLPGGMANPLMMQGNQSLYLVTCALVLMGAIGFPVWVNIKEILAQRWRRLRYLFARRQAPHERPRHIYDLNTRMVLTVTMTLYALGAVGFFIFEYHNTLEGMSLYDKVVQSVFNAFTPRCAGFVSVSPAAFMNVTILMVLLQMCIGGASQSMGGGIKVNTFGTLLATAKAGVLGRQGVTAFHRCIAPGSVRRAMAVLVLAVAALTAFSMALLALQPEMSAKALIFETASALFTVGSSFGVTPELHPVSKCLLCVAMFIGRVGIVSLLAGFILHPRDTSRNYPTDNVIIN